MNQERKCVSLLGQPVKHYISIEPTLPYDMKPETKCVSLLGQRLKRYTNIEPMLPYNMSRETKSSQQTRDVEPMLVHCWSTVYDAGPTLN